MAETFSAVSVSDWRDKRGNCSSYGTIKDTLHAPVGKCAPVHWCPCGFEEQRNKNKKKKSIINMGTNVLTALLSVVSLTQLVSWCSQSALPGDKINSAARSRHLKLCCSRDLEKCQFKFARTCRILIRKPVQIFGDFPR